MLTELARAVTPTPLRRPAEEALMRLNLREHAAWIILLVATQQTLTNLVRSGRKQR